MFSITTSQESGCNERFFSGDPNTRQPGRAFQLPEHLDVYTSFIVVHIVSRGTHHCPCICYTCRISVIYSSNVTILKLLLAGLTVQDFTRLQRLQNAAARCVLMRPRDFSATDMLCELHWLPVRKRVDYKLLLLTYKTLNGSAPEYLVNQLQDYCPTRALRSGDQNLLSVKKTCIKIGDSSFAVAASVLWNARYHVK